ncbi:MAG: imidazoleglycerol-phosphate dehydratase HisB [Vampirovibrionia bacterium]
MRDVVLRRDTAETKVLVEIGFDEYKEMEINTPINFLNHMLKIFCFHSRFKLDIEASSHDKDPHHLVEDVAITLGMCFKNALGNKKNINRYGYSCIPMDDALVMTSVDLSGRAYCKYDLQFTHSMINDMSVDLIRHFFESFSANALCTLHIKQINGIDDHHIAEAAFKSLAHTLSQAVAITNRYNDSIPSSKGVI